MGARADREAPSGWQTQLGQGPLLPLSAAPISASKCVHVWPHREQGQRWSPIGSGQRPGRPHIQRGLLLV